VLLGLDNAGEQVLAAERVRKENLTFVPRNGWSNRCAPARSPPQSAKPPRHKRGDLRRLEKRLQQHVGTRVRIVGKAGAGKIEIQYFSPEDLIAFSNCAACHRVEMDQAGG